jgi:hypothetical protein
MPGFTSPSPTTKMHTGKHIKGSSSARAKVKSSYPNTMSFASPHIPKKRTGGRSKSSFGG